MLGFLGTILEIWVGHRRCTPLALWEIACATRDDPKWSAGGIFRRERAAGVGVVATLESFPRTPLTVGIDGRDVDDLKAGKGLAINGPYQECPLAFVSDDIDHDLVSAG